MTAEIDNHPSAELTPEMLLRAALKNASQYSSIVLIMIDAATNEADVQWSSQAVERLVYLERVLAARITAEIFDE